MGQIQTPQMELEAFCAQLAPVFLEYLRTHGTAVDRIEIATSLDGITSLPARYSLGGVEKNVLAPLKLLTKDVDVEIAACQQATAKANTAADDANAAAKKVTDAITDISAEKAAAQAATAKANAAATNADNKRGEIERNEAVRQANETTRQSQESARQTAEAARKTGETTRQSNETKRQTDAAAKLAELETARGNAVNAATKASSAADAANREATSVNAAKSEALAAAARASSTATTAEAEIEKMKQLQESISGAASLAPTRMELTYTKRITWGNPYVQHITARLFPSYALQNVLFLGDEGAVSVDPSGTVTPKRTGRSRVHVIPTQATHLYETIEIEVAAPSVRLTGNGRIRLDSKGNIRLT